ncbi:MAG: redox-sensing transcriptional repressor Rex [Deltaproteobacteria bacterium]|nr:redox-sensing transcriptional repressor Rex [Deltaproteobacteria bacterium]
MPKKTKIPNATIERISLYARPLEILLREGTSLISSEGLADLCRVNPAQVRKDLSYFGEFGVRGVGYAVGDLLEEIRKILFADRVWRLAIVGLGNMGTALVRQENFARRGYRFVAAFDSDPGKVGGEAIPGLRVHPLKDLQTLVQEAGIEVGVIATPPSQAQNIADILVDAGIRAILNFSPILIRQPQGTVVENVDFTVSLENLAYRLSKVD